VASSEFTSFDSDKRDSRVERREEKKSSISDDPVMEALVQQIAYLCDIVQNLSNKFIKLEREQHASYNPNRPFNKQKIFVLNRKAKRIDSSPTSTSNNFVNSHVQVFL